MRAKMGVVLLAVLGGSIALVAEESTPISYAAQVEPILISECGDCHGAEKPKKGLDMSKGQGYAHLVGKPSNEVPELLLVKPGDPDGSYVWHKLEHKAEKGRGMPRTIFSSKMLPAAELEVIKRWIADGAKP
jgi:hypothetical protein